MRFAHGLSAPARAGGVLVVVVLIHVGAFYAVIVAWRYDGRRERNDEFVTRLFFVTPKMRSHGRVRKSIAAAPTSVVAGIRESLIDSAPPAISPIDWDLARSELAGEIAQNPSRETHRSLRSDPKTIPPLRPEEWSKGIFPVPPRRKGKIVRYDDGEVIVWVSDVCYRTNRPEGGPGPQEVRNPAQVFCDPPPPRDDIFDHLKPKYLFKPDEQRVPDPRDANPDNLP